MLRLGLIVNPFAGVGGPAARKGSDAPETQTAAASGILALTAPARLAVFLKHLLPIRSDIEMVTIDGAMGAEHCRAAGFAARLVDFTPTAPSTAEDTVAAAQLMLSEKVDLLVFAGGDGTARDVCRAVGSEALVLGVPAGVKMHSGVFAVNPQAAAEIVRQMAAGELVRVMEAEVRDIDEAALQQGRVKSRFFGSLRVPDEAQYVQHVKQGGREVDELVLADIAAEIEEDLDRDALYILGPGSTLEQVAAGLNWPATLLGIDVYRAGQPLLADADGASLEALVQSHSGAIYLFLTVIGGQGHVLGRGNQQISPALLRRIGRENLRIVATRGKLNGLHGRALILDSGDPALDREWAGYATVLTGYHDRVLYPMGRAEPSGGETHQLQH